MTKTVSAKLKYLNMSPRKTRAVARLLKGLTANAAEAELMFSTRRAGGALLKLLQSAVANAKHNHKADVAQLYVQDIRVDAGPKVRRWMPRARGSASPIDKKKSHVTLVLGVSDTPKALPYVFREKPKKEEGKKDKKRKEKKSEEKPREPKVVPEVKPVLKPGFFQRVFRRKSI